MALQGTYLLYPAPPGDKRIGIAQVKGPASYASIAVATPPTGGITVKASDLGLIEVETIVGTPASDDGQYYLVPMVSTLQGAPQKTLQFLAVVANTGAQVTATTNLSARTFIIMALGS